MSEQAQMVLGALADSGGSLLASDMRSRYDFTQPEWPSTPAGPTPPQVNAIFNIEKGMQEVQTNGLAEMRRDHASGVQRLCLTELGQQVVSA